MKQEFINPMSAMRPIRRSIMKTDIFGNSMSIFNSYGMLPFEEGLFDKLDALGIPSEKKKTVIRSNTLNILNDVYKYMNLNSSSLLRKRRPFGFMNYSNDFYRVASVNPFTGASLFASNIPIISTLFTPNISRNISYKTSNPFFDFEITSDYSLGNNKKTEEKKQASTNTPTPTPATTTSTPASVSTPTPSSTTP